MVDLGEKCTESDWNSELFENGNSDLLACWVVCFKMGGKYWQSMEMRMDSPSTSCIFSLAVEMLMVPAECHQSVLGLGFSLFVWKWGTSVNSSVATLKWQLWGICTWYFVLTPRAGTFLCPTAKRTYYLLLIKRYTHTSVADLIDMLHNGEQHKANEDSPPYFMDTHVSWSASMTPDDSWYQFISMPFISHVCCWSLKTRESPQTNPAWKPITTWGEGFLLASPILASSLAGDGSWVDREVS